MTKIETYRLRRRGGAVPESFRIQCILGVICIDALINGFKVVLCSIYAPNKDDPAFINEVNKTLGSKEGHIMSAGDFTQVMDPVNLGHQLCSETAKLYIC